MSIQPFTPQTFVFCAARKQADHLGRVSTLDMVEVGRRTIYTQLMFNKMWAFARQALENQVECALYRVEGQNLVPVLSDKILKTIQEQELAAKKDALVSLDKKVKATKLAMEEEGLKKRKKIIEEEEEKVIETSEFDNVSSTPDLAEEDIEEETGPIREVFIPAYNSEELYLPFAGPALVIESEPVI